MTISEAITLNPRDPYERVLIDMVETYRRKRADYAEDGSPWSNFDDIEVTTGTSFNTSVEMFIAVKTSRLKALRSNNRDPANESIVDSWLDRAVYAVIGLARLRYPNGVVKDE